MIIQASFLIYWDLFLQGCYTAEKVFTGVLSLWVPTWLESGTKTTFQENEEVLGRGLAYALGLVLVFAVNFRVRVRVPGTNREPETIFWPAPARPHFTKCQQLTTSVVVPTNDIRSANLWCVGAGTGKFRLVRRLFVGGKPVSHIFSHTANASVKFGTRHRWLQRVTVRHDVSCHTVTHAVTSFSEVRNNYLNIRWFSVSMARLIDRKIDSPAMH